MASAARITQKTGGITGERKRKGGTGKERRERIKKINTNVILQFHSL